MELDTYNRDPTTLARTSLLRPSHTISGKLAAAFPSTDAPVLRTLALISLDLGDGTSVEKKVERNLARMKKSSGENHELDGLFENNDKNGTTESDTTQNKSDKHSSSNKSANGANSSTTSSTIAVSTAKDDQTRPPEDPEPIHSSQHQYKLQPIQQQNEDVQKPCKSGTGCRRSDCFYGHHRPYKTSKGCKKPQCSFNARGMHKVDEMVVDSFIQS